MLISVLAILDNTVQKFDVFMAPKIFNQEDVLNKKSYLSPSIEFLELGRTAVLLKLKTWKTNRFIPSQEIELQ